MIIVVIKVTVEAVLKYCQLILTKKKKKDKSIDLSEKLANDIFSVVKAFSRM